MTYGDQLGRADSWSSEHTDGAPRDFDRTPETFTTDVPFEKGDHHWETITTITTPETITGDDVRIPKKGASG